MEKAQTIKRPPLVVTVSIDDESQKFFSEMRAKHFPAHSNYLDAHITLFHQLPSGEQSIRDAIKHATNICAFPIDVSEIRFLGNGVAYGLESEVLKDLHIHLQKVFEPFLISQDRQKLWPHITIQNKVTAHKAQNLFDTLRRDFKPFKITATGISTWLYMKGPWLPVSHFPFQNSGN